jgi:hypothetical protein
MARTSENQLNMAQTLKVIETREELCKALNSQEEVVIRDCSTDDGETDIIGVVQMVEWEDGSGNCFNIRIWRKSSNGESTLIFKRFKQVDIEFDELGRPFIDGIPPAIHELQEKTHTPDIDLLNEGVN